MTIAAYTANDLNPAYVSINRYSDGIHISVRGAADIPGLSGPYATITLPHEAFAKLIADCVQDGLDPLFREQSLSVDVTCARLVISIGISTLKHAVERGAEWPEKYSITDADKFASEIKERLLAESENGTTPIHRAFDAAALDALENGAEGVSETRGDDPQPDPFERIPREKLARAFGVSEGRAKARLETLSAMTPEATEAAAEAAYTTACASNERYEQECREQDGRLEKMLAQVTAWEPPSANHIELKSFMIDQLTISKSGSYRPEPPKKLSGAEWLQAETKSAHHDIGYHAAEHAKEVARANDRTQWVRLLRKSLAPDSSIAREG